MSGPSIFRHGATAFIFQWEIRTAPVCLYFILHEFSHRSCWCSHFNLLVLLQNRMPLANFILYYWNFTISLSFIKRPNWIFIFAVIVVGVVTKFSYRQPDGKSKVAFFIPGDWWKSIGWRFALGKRFGILVWVGFKMFDWLAVMIKGLVA